MLAWSPPAAPQVKPTEMRPSRSLRVTPSLVGEGLAPDLIQWLEESYLTFHRRMRTFLQRRQCSCDACARAPELTLRLIAHYGRYSRQRIGETGRVHGVDVIVPHRLAKKLRPFA